MYFPYVHRINKKLQLGESTFQARFRDTIEASVDTRCATWEQEKRIDVLEKFWRDLFATILFYGFVGQRRGRFWFSSICSTVNCVPCEASPSVSCLFLPLSGGMSKLSARLVLRISSTWALGKREVRMLSLPYFDPREGIRPRFASNRRSHDLRDFGLNAPIGLHAFQEVGGILIQAWNSAMPLTRRQDAILKKRLSRP